MNRPIGPKSPKTARPQQIASKPLMPLVNNDIFDGMSDEKNDFDLLSAEHSLTKLPLKNRMMEVKPNRI
jgi:hypothetical protein